MIRRRQFISRNRDGFTLVELLMVIAIIGILAATVLFAMAGAQESARSERTRSQIRKLNSFITTRWEDLLASKVRINGTILEQRARTFVNQNPPAPVSRQHAIDKLMAQYRVDVTREMLRMNLPDRKTDLQDFPFVNLRADPSSYDARYRYGSVAALPALWLAYQQKAEQLIRSKYHSSNHKSYNANSIYNWRSDDLWTPQFESAECLYLILSQIVEEDRSALEFFSENEIADADNDGMPEIVDSWGTPIFFLRWAPGYGVSELATSISYDSLDPLGIYAGFPAGVYQSTGTLRGRKTASANHRTYALRPLIFSAGPDKKAGISTGMVGGFSYVDGNEPSNLQIIPPNNPYVGIGDYQVDNADFSPFGAFVPDANGSTAASAQIAADNIYNYQELQVRGTP